jgi:O-Antigen ligase/Tetratricopeptide repeat
MAHTLTSAGVSSARLSRAAVSRVPWLAVASLLLVAGTGFAGGGYFPSSWGWPALAAAWAAALALLADDAVSLGRLGAAAAALLATLAAWTAFGAVWSIDVTQTVLEAERTSVYAAALLAALLWARRHPERLLHGVWGAAVLLCGWALVTRLVPDRFGVVDPISRYRLSEPIGYWNALGLLAAMGMLLGAGLAARASSRLGRAAAAASLPPLTLTLYFTFSRGAWAALALGLLASLALARRRLQLLALLGAVSPWIALVVWRAAVSPALTTTGSALPDMARQGHRVALVLVAASAAAALSALVIARLEPRVHVPARWQRAATVAIVSLALVAMISAFVRFGSPVTIATHAWKSFSGGSVAQTGNLNSRLFHLSSTGRTAQWHVAWIDAQKHPLLGSGAGTFERVWFENRPVPSKVRDAHNLYIETLAELGPFGLALLVAILALPLAAGLRSRDRPLVFAAFGAYVAFVLHVAVDWDWEIAAVTLAALLCGAALLATPGRPLGVLGRRAALAGAAVLAATGVYTIASQLPLKHLRSAAARGDWPAAQRAASRASALAPWSAQPWLTLGEADLKAGRLPEARDALLKAVAKSPKDWTAWADLAEATWGPERAHALARAAALNPLGTAR